MPPTPPPPLNPSHAVERIREIIVGRHLEKLESRVALIESGESHAQLPRHWEDRLCTVEARLEAVQHAVQRINDSHHEESAMRTLQQREEIQRLAAQIQQVAALKSASDPQPAIDRLEQKIGTWLNNWQGALQTHLSERETRIASEIRGEVATLWESTESQLTRLQSRVIDREMIEERFSRIAAAARALAESAAPFTSGNEYAKP